ALPERGDPAQGRAQGDRQPQQRRAGGHGGEAAGTQQRVDPNEREHRNRRSRRPGESPTRVVQDTHLPPLFLDRAAAHGETRRDVHQYHTPRRRRLPVLPEPLRVTARTAKPSSLGSTPRFNALPRTWIRRRQDALKKATPFPFG